MQPPTSASVSGGGDGPIFTMGRLRRGWTLFLLSCVAFFYMLDRNALLITQELIKHEFGLSDTQIGLLAGAAYGISYAVAALPMGWLIDRGNRRKLLAAVVTIWSSLTALCGLSNNFLHLLVARVGIGVSEAGGQPTAFSIISGIYPPEKRSGAGGVYFAGAAFGALLAAGAGGYIAQAYGWRAVFFIYGLPGVILGLLILLTVPEPRESARPQERVADHGPSFLSSAGRLLLDQRLRWIYASLALIAVVSNGLNGWVFAYLLRVRGWDLQTVGQTGALMGVSAVGGMILTGLLGDRARRFSPGGPAFLAAIAALFSLSVTFIWVFATSPALILVGLCLAAFALGSYSPPSNALIAEAAPEAQRGLAFSLSTLATNMIGATFGATLIGALSDFTAANLPDFNPLRTGIMAVALLLVPCAGLYGFAGWTINKVSRNAAGNGRSLAAASAG